ncbi:hypothetical protein ABEF94_016070 [Exophiala dermatitidis]
MRHTRSKQQRNSNSSRNSWDYYKKRSSHSRTSNETSTTKLKAVAAGRSVRLTPNRALQVSSTSSSSSTATSISFSLS